MTAPQPPLLHWRRPWFWLLLAFVAVLAVTEYQLEQTLRRTLGELQQPVSERAWSPLSAALVRALGALVPLLPLFVLTAGDPRWRSRAAQVACSAGLALNALLWAVLLPTLSAWPRDPVWLWPAIFLALLLFVLVAPARWTAWLGPRRPQ